MAAKQHGAPKVVANWVLRDVMQALNERELSIDDSPFTPGDLARLIRLAEAERCQLTLAISSKRALPNDAQPDPGGHQGQELHLTLLLRQLCSLFTKTLLLPMSKK